MPTKKDLKKNEQGVWIVAGRKADKTKKKDEVPSLERVRFSFSFSSLFPFLSFFFLRKKK